VTGANGGGIGTILDGVSGGWADRGLRNVRVGGDDLAPDEVTKVLRIVPTTAYAKGEHYAAVPCGPDLIALRLRRARSLDA
jgi:hypothetical protein